MTNTPIPSDLLAVRDFVHDLRALEAPPGHERAMPTVFVVPSATVTSPPAQARAGHPWRVGLAATGLAASVAALALLPDWSPRVPQSPPPAPVSPRVADTPASELAQWLSPFPSLAYAQSPTAAPVAPYAPAANLNTQRLVAGARSYIRLSANDYHGLIPDSRYETVITRTTHNGRDSWQVIATTPIARRLQTRDASPSNAAIVDTSWLDATTLRPLERRLHVAVMHVKETYTETEAVQTISMILPPTVPAAAGNTPAMKPVVTRRAMDASRPLVMNDAGLRLLLRSLPLRDGWKGSIAVPVQQGGAVGGVTGAPRTINLRVAGADTVQLFSGRYACWRVLIELGTQPAVWMVSQETGETLVTDGSNGLSYPESKTYLLYGLEETQSQPSVRRR